jgi:hypothetical protein
MLIVAFAAAATLTFGVPPSDSKAPAAPVTTVRGILVAKTATTLEVRPEDEKEARHIVLAPPGSKFDPKFQAFLDSLEVGSEVEVTQTGDAMHRSTNVTLLGKPGQSGKIVGTVTAKSNMPVGELHSLKADPGKPAWWIEITDDKGNAERYMPHWTAKGLAPEMIEAIGRRFVGDRVEIRKSTDDHIWVSTMRVLSISPAAMTQPGFEGGTVVGKVTAKDKESITLVFNGGGGEQRYLPQRIVGEKDGLDKDVLKTIAAAKVGDLVEGKWFKDGERRLYSLKPATAVRPPQSQPGPIGH